MPYYLLRCYRVMYDGARMDEDDLSAEPEIRIMDEYLIPLSQVCGFRKYKDGYLVKISWARHEFLVKGQIKESIIDGLHVLFRQKA